MFNILHHITTVSLFRKTYRKYQDEDSLNACASQTIFQFGTYSWQADVETPGGNLSQTGNITVGVEEQLCELK